MTDKLQPLIRWAGSKRSAVDRLAHYWPSNAARYIEPFAGSACLFFRLRPQAAILADLNSELIITYRALARDAELVVQCYRRLPLGERAYYAIRQMDPLTLSEAEVAARFLYLNRHCFNGLYRTNQQGKFNVPYGPPKGNGGDFVARIREASGALRGATFMNTDFESTLQSVEAGDFVYLDPPYVVERRRIFSEYLPGSFSSADLTRLGAALHRLDRIGTTFLVTYGDSREARELLAPWATRRVWTRRNIAGFSGARRGAYELWATNAPWWSE